jgi:drug/metabolite transporter (DMT)-like permease
VDQAVLCGLLSALSYGIADYVSQVAGRTVGVWRTSFYYYLTGFIVLSVWLFAQPEAQHNAQHAPLNAWAAALGSGVLLLCAVVLFTQGLVKGQIAVVAPVTATYGAVTTCLSILLGERFSLQALAGLVLIMGGASILALPGSVDSSVRRRSGIGWAAAAAFAYGGGFWLQGTFAVPKLGPLIPVWLAYASGLFMLGLLYIAGAVPLAPPDRMSLLIPTLWASVFGIGGFIALTVGLDTQRVAVVVVLSSLTSAVTVILARAFSAMRLSWHQWIALATIIGGLVLIRL